MQKLHPQLALAMFWLTQEFYLAKIRAQMVQIRAQMFIISCVHWLATDRARESKQIHPLVVQAQQHLDPLQDRCPIRL
jgi:hypothetical protein